MGLQDVRVGDSADQLRWDVHKVYGPLLLTLTHGHLTGEFLTTLHST